MVIACGYGSTMVIAGTGKAGSVVACGRNLTGQLGVGNIQNADSLVAVKGPLGQKRALSVAAGLAHSMALTEFGSVFCWGAGVWYDGPTCLSVLSDDPR